MTKPVTRKMAVECLLHRLATDAIIGKGGEIILPCGICKEPLLPGQAIQFDHTHADTHGGAHKYWNLRPVHYDPCHKKKTKADVQAKAKGDRIAGVTKTKPAAKIRSRNNLRRRP